MHSRKRNRMRHFDYSSDAVYFITICIKDKIPCFGEVVNGKMVFNKFGAVVEKQVQWLERQYPYCELHNFVVMPNHIHLLFRIDRIKVKNEDVKIKSVSSLMGALKTTSSKQIHLLGNRDFIWQRSFHDHIVGSTESYEKIDQYITNNPENWDKDKFRNEE